MKRIEIATKGYTFDFDQAKATGRLIAEKENDFATLVSWCDKDQQKHSPCCLKCMGEIMRGDFVFLLMLIALSLFTPDESVQKNLYL